MADYNSNSDSRSIGTNPTGADVSECSTVSNSAGSEEVGAEQLTNLKGLKKHRRMLALAALIMAAFVVLLIFIVKFIIPASQYKSAMVLIEEGQYVKAYERLIRLSDYKDSAVKASEIYSRYKIEKLRMAQVGNFISFGTYEQDNNLANGKEEIEWLVLENEGSKAFVISRYALDCQKYNATYTDVTWENCTLRTWLNGSFFHTAFNEEEQNAILHATVVAEKNPNSDSSPGQNTKDQVFLLSISEAQKYFETEEDRRCAPTAYAVAQGAWTSSRITVDDKPTGWWWLRTPGNTLNRAADVNYLGAVYARGVFADYDDDCVRPAMWIDLSLDEN